MNKNHKNSIFLKLFKRYFLFFLLIFSSVIKGQSFGIQIEEETEEISNEELLKEAQPNLQEVRQVSFSDIEKKYDSQDFDYSETEKGKAPTFLAKIWEFIVKLFDFSLDRNGREVRNIIFFVIFVVALFVAIRLIMNHKGRWFFEKKDKKYNISAEEAEKHIHLADFQSLIQQSEKQNDRRQSIRLYYLWLLKSLSDADQIQWAVEKTNSDYQREIKDPDIKNAFSKLSYLYNYIWYGEFPIENTDYQKVKFDFETYINIKKSKI